jgi:hypothetical protein
MNGHYTGLRCQTYPSTNILLQFVGDSPGFILFFSYYSITYGALNGWRGMWWGWCTVCSGAYFSRGDVTYYTGVVDDDESHVLSCYGGWCFWSYVVDSISCLMLVGKGFCFLGCYTRIFVVVLFLFSVGVWLRCFHWSGVVSICMSEFLTGVWNTWSMLKI